MPPIARVGFRPFYRSLPERGFSFLDHVEGS
jgi:hypothetical protein